MLNIIQGNRLETLADSLIELLQTPLADPFAQEVIVIQNPGIGRWLNYRITDALGICANTDFILPSSFLWQIYKQNYNLCEHDLPFDREHLCWEIYTILRKNDLDFWKELQEYRKDGDLLRLWKLADNLAGLYDRYMLYRPQWLLDWENNSETDEGLAKLWQQVLTETAEKDENHQFHRARLQQDFSTQLKTGSIKNPDSLPERVFVFAVDTLPQLQIEHFSGISEYCQILFFVHNPSRYFWQDIRSAKEQLHMKVQDEYVTEGNRLLATMGRNLRDFLATIDNYQYKDIDLFEKTEPDSLLKSIQTDILDLAENNKYFNDDSIIFYSCYSNTRELENLQNYLLRCFEKDRTLEPADIAIMAPDINRYAPMIDAIFGRERFADNDKSHFIPYTIADRLATEAEPLLRSFLNLLHLPDSRFTESEILDFIATDAVAKKFGINTEQFPLIQNWLEKSGIRWGINEESRSILDLPQTRENSWQGGFDRLLAGYLTASDNRTFAITPYSDIEGNDVAVLGQVIEIIRKLQEWRDIATTETTIFIWQQRLCKLLETFFSETENDAAAYMQIRQVLAELAEADSSYKNKSAIDLHILLQIVEPQLQEPGKRNRFLTGQMTFCNFQPMRSIPFKIICLLGMNDDSFPRTETKSSLDLMQKEKRQICDRDCRDDDRYLFLQALLSAREKLFISFIGKNINDGSDKQPSALVSELIDYIAAKSTTEMDDVYKNIVKQVPLQPFSIKLFSNCNDIASHDIASYDSNWFKVINNEAKTKDSESLEITADAPEESIINLADIKNFFGFPAKVFLERYLDARIPKHSWNDFLHDLYSDEEPFTIDYLDWWKIKDSSLSCSLKEGRETLKTAKYDYLFPQGAIKDSYIEQLGSEIAEYLEELGDDLDWFKKAETYSKTVAIGNYIIDSGNHLLNKEINHYYVRVNTAKKLKAEKILLLWIDHLTIQLINGETDGAIYYSEEKYYFESLPKNESAEILSQLVQLYRKGLEKPLLFFPEISYRYAKETTEGKDHQEILKTLEKEWSKNSDYGAGELYRFANRKLFGNRLPMYEQGFTDIAMLAYKECLKQLRKDR